jgi:hypothetical protein
MASELVRARQVALAAWPVYVCWFVLQYHHFTVILRGAFLDAGFPKVSGSPRDHNAPDDWHTSRRLQLLFVLTAISSSKKLITGTYVVLRD